MNTLKEKLHSDLVDAMKHKDNTKKEVIKLVIGRVTIEEKDPKGKEITDDLILSFIKSQVKSTKEAIVEFEKGNRQDLIDQANREIEVLQSYLPTQLSDEEVKDIIVKKVEELNLDIANLGPKEFGLIMKNVMPVIGKQADGNTVKRIVQSL